MRRKTCSSSTLSAGCAVEEATLPPPPTWPMAKVDGYWNRVRTSHFQDFDSGFVIWYFHSIEASQDVSSSNAARVGLVVGGGSSNETSVRMAAERESNWFAGSKRDEHHASRGRAGSGELKARGAEKRTAEKRSERGVRWFCDHGATHWTCHVSGVIP